MYIKMFDRKGRIIIFICMVILYFTTLYLRLNWLYITSLIISLTIVYLDKKANK